MFEGASHAMKRTWDLHRDGWRGAVSRAASGSALSVLLHMMSIKCVEWSALGQSVSLLTKHMWMRLGKPGSARSYVPDVGAEVVYFGAGHAIAAAAERAYLRRLVSSSKSVGKQRRDACNSLIAAPRDSDLGAVAVGRVTAVSYHDDQEPYCRLRIEVVSWHGRRAHHEAGAGGAARRKAKAVEALPALCVTQTKCFHCGEEGGDLVHCDSVWCPCVRRCQVLSHSWR